MPQVTFAGFLIVSTLNYFLVRLYTPSTVLARSLPRPPPVHLCRHACTLALVSRLLTHSRKQFFSGGLPAQIYMLGIDVEESPINR